MNSPSPAILLHSVPHRIGWCCPALVSVILSQSTNLMLISSRHTHTDIPRNNVLLAIWPSFSLLKLTHKINHHRMLVTSRTKTISLIEILLWRHFFLLRHWKFLFLTFIIGLVISSRMIQNTYTLLGPLSCVRLWISFFMVYFSKMSWMHIPYLSHECDLLHFYNIGLHGSIFLFIYNIANI